MTDLSRDIWPVIQERIADGVTVAAVPATGAIWYWLDKAEFLLRAGVTLGTFLLVWFAVWVKFKGRGKS